MNNVTTGTDMAAAVAPLHALAARRLPLRATGLLGIAGVMLLALLLVASALWFRTMVQDHLEALASIDVRHSMLLQSRLDEAAGPAAASRLRGLDLQLEKLGGERAAHLAQARHFIDGGTVALACLAWLGITSIGALAMLFFSRLAVDIRVVRARALAILTGERRRAPPLSRNDELGDLAQAVDHLADALARRERDLAIERRHVMHREKLAAVGSMAAGVLREIGNPIAAIDGYARAMLEARPAGAAAPAEAWCDPAPILRETGRLLAITHDIGALAAPPASQWQLTSPNDIVTQAIALLRYEPRLAGTSVVCTLDPQVPAVQAVADRLVLLLTNLVINAADAVAALPARTSRIELATRCAAGGVELCVSDNGSGMDVAVRERAFEPLFTTKTAGRGTGLGLPLCRAIAHDHGGRIELESQAGKGTRVRVWLPLDAEAPATLMR